MKLRALILFCSAPCLIISTPHEERLEEAVRKSDAPFVRYHVAGLAREGMSRTAQKKLLESLVPFADKIVQDEKSHVTLSSKDLQVAKIMGGLGSCLIGYTYGMAPDQKTGSEQGVKAIYDDWKRGYRPDFKHFLEATIFISFFAAGIGLIFDGVRNIVTTDQKVVDAQAVRKILKAHQEELGS